MSNQDGTIDVTFNGAKFDAADTPDAMPETLEINGVTYRRDSDFVDKQVNRISEFQEIAKRTGISLRQAVWFRYLNDQAIMPD